MKILSIFFVFIVIISTSAMSQRQDTIPVYIAVDDTTFRPDIWYAVPDAYGDTTIAYYSNEYYHIESTIAYYSNEYYHIEWGWEINGKFYNMKLEPLNPKFKVLNSYVRDIDLYGKSLIPIEEIIVNGDTTIIEHPDRIWFQSTSK